MNRITKLVYTQLLNNIYRNQYIISFVRTMKQQQLGSDDLNIIEEILIKNPDLQKIDKQSLQEKYEILKQFNISSDSIVKNAHILKSDTKKMTYHAEILLECGFKHLTLENLFRYYILVKKFKIIKLKADRLIPPDLNVKKELFSAFKNLPEHFDTQKCYHTDENLTLFDIRFQILEKYLKWKVKMSVDEFKCVIKTYNQFKHKPLALVEEAIDFAQKVLQLSDERIKAFPFVMTVDPVNSRNIIDKVKNIGEMTSLEAVQYNPALLKATYTNILEIQSILKKYDIQSHYQQKPFFIYLLKPETVEKRLKELLSVPECKVLFYSQRKLLMVLHKNKLMKRLETLKNMNKKCISIQNLLRHEKIFLKENKEDLNITSEIVDNILRRLCGDHPSSELKHLREHILNRLKMHDNFKNIPILSIISSLEYLQTNFSNEDILSTCSLLLYSKDVIERVYNDLYNEAKINDDDTSLEEIEQPYNINELMINVNMELLTKKQILDLILYLLERQRNFSNSSF